MPAFVLALWLAFSSGDARPGVAVEVDDCLEVDTAAVREAIELRLGAGPEYHGGAAHPGDTRLWLDCGVDSTVELTVVDPLGEVSSTRSAALPPADHRVARLGELAASAVRATWLNLALERPDEGRRTPAQRVAARVARRPASAWELGDGFAVRSFFAPATPALMLAEQVEVVHRPLRHLAWKADGELGFWRVPGERDGVTGEIATLTISAAPALLGWGEIPSRHGRAAGTVAIYGGAGFRAGGVRMRSEAFGETGFRSFAGPLALARVSVSLGRFVGLAVDLEAGWLLHGPRRPNAIPLELIGPWQSAVLVLVSRF